MKITKKLLALLLSVLVLVGTMPAIAVSAEELTTEDGFKYTVTDGKAKITGYEGEAAELTIPETLDGATVTAIDDWAFEDNTAITSVTIPDTVESIESRAFFGCTALKSVNLPANLVSLGNGAFGKTAIESVNIPKSLEKADYSYSSHKYTVNGVELSVSEGPFVLCDNLKTVTFESGAICVPSNIFRGCTGIDEITLPDTVTTIKSAAFKDCVNLKSIDVPDAVTKIEADAFSGCASLKDVKLSKSLTVLGNAAFFGTPIETIEIPRALDEGDYSYSYHKYTVNGVEYSVTEGPFALCDNLKTITFEKGTTQIAENLFRGCTGLETITLPDTVTVIESSAFKECLNLKSIVVPDHVTKIETDAFSGCASLKDVKLSKGLTVLGFGAFGGTPIESIEIPKALDEGDYSYSTWSFTLNGVDYSVTSGPFVGCDNLKTVTFEEGTTQVAENLFRGCTGLEKIVIPEGVTIIESGAFDGALQLKDIIIPSTVVEIGANAFELAASLESIELAENIEKIGYRAFKNCDSLKSFEVENPDAVLGDGALAENKALTDVKLPANLVEIEAELFQNDTALKTVVIPETVTAIRRAAFENCTSLENITIPENVEELGDNLFKGCENLSTVTFADYSVKEIPENAFAECYGLKAITLPKGIEVIEGNAFVNCIELADVVIPESATEISDTAFSYPSKTTIYSQSGSYVEDYATDGGFKFVDNVTDVETIKLKDGATKLILEEDKTYKLELDITPADANEYIKLTSSDDFVVAVDGMELKTSFWNETVEIMAETLSGATLTFEVYVRGIDYIRFAEDSAHQTKYATGDEFNTDGFKLEAVYSDDSVAEIDGYTFSGFDSSEPGECKVFVNWVDNNGDEYEYYFYVEILGEEPPKFQSQKDESTEIVVEAITNASLSVVEVTEKIKFDEVNLKLSGQTVSKFYDITLVEDGEAVQPDGTVTVKIPCDDETAKVYRFEDDGTLTDMKAEFVDGFMVFTTEHFSYYVVTVAASEFETGDVNGDGKLNIKDATAIQKFVAKLVVFDDSQLALADFNGDSKVNVKDATQIQKKIAGLI
ncbi:MAG: leucine-rich repeat protein [Clostridia bacterium]|nr:leucine-rich repeat protein [Clostridia bacterium]